MILQAELHQASVYTLVTKCDITSEEDVKRLIETTHERFGRVDVLINNAGFGRFGGVEIVSADEARAQLEVNTIAPMRLAQLGLAYHARAGGRADHQYLLSCGTSGAAVGRLVFRLKVCS